MVSRTDFEQILALLRVWSDQSIQDMLDGATRTADIYRRIVDCLLQEGSFQRRPKQYKDKIKSLWQFYKYLTLAITEVDLTGTTGLITN